MTNKRKPTPQEKKTRKQWAKEKQSLSGSDWMKVIFNDQSQICTGEDAVLMKHIKGTPDINSHSSQLLYDVE